MKLATTTGDFVRYTTSAAEKVRLFEGTGFRHLDYSFYSVIYPGSPFLTDHWMDEVQAAGREGERLGFDFVQAHSPSYDFGGDDESQKISLLATIRSIEACGHLGISNIVVHTGTYNQLRYPADKAAYFVESKKFLEMLIPHMEKHHVNVLIENSAEQNARGLFFFMTPQEMTEFVAYFNHPLLHICWDVGHANMRGSDPLQDVLALGGELRAIHVQDNFGACDEHLAPFMGTLPLDSLLQGLLKIDYKGYFTFEADNILAADGAWPHPRRKFPLLEPARLKSPSPALKQKAIALLYEIGKYTLQQYNCFEE